ncbi:MAG: M48 family metalloprotease, partial [Pseudomonadota bacterium]|nr:M48 family metalloprotease [Pseudomonadota bacterium]
RDGRAQAAMGIIGVALFVIGYVGVFFGRLIQAAVSRQREMLADASSVQFTRNPEGIAGALFKIGLKGGYLDTTSHASDMNHMCFGESARMKLTSLLASHPPVEERINAIQPGMLARLRSRLRDTEPGTRLYSTSEPANEPATAAFAGGQARGSTSPLASNVAPSSNTRKFSDQVGTVNRRSEDFALQFLERLPATFRNLLYTRAGAIQLCYALLISELPREQQTERLALLSDHPVLGSQPDLLDKLLPALKTIGEGVRFPALELAMPALRKLDPEERELLITNVQKLVAADNRVTLFELALTSFLSRHLGDEAERVVPVRYRNYRPVLPALQRVLSLMARAGTADQDEAQVLYREAMAGFADSRGSNETGLEKVTMRQLREALTALNGLSPLLKPAVIDACGYCITRDGRIDIREYELMRLVADQIDCPMPPLAV